jgi:hypothetical protein
MVDRKRERLLTVRMNDAEMAMLDELAAIEGVSSSEWVRNVVRREYTLANVQPSKKPKKK